MEHAGAKTLDNWYANRELPFPTSLRKLAVIAPDTSPGLAALRQRLAQRAAHPLRCDHYAAGFNQAGSASLEQAFEQLRIQHAIEPYDLVLLVDGSADALGIAESNGIIPGQVSRTPAPVWSAIGEDDANTELGDVANRVFASVSALIEALPLAVTAQPDIARSSTAANDTAATAAVMRQPAAEAIRPAVVHLPVLATASTAAPAAATGTHPLVLCAAGAVILASFTAIAAMLGWLPNQQQGVVATPAHAVASTTPTPTPAHAVASTAPAPVPVVPPAPASPPPAPAPALAVPSESTPEPAATPASPQTRGNEEPDDAPLGTVAALGAAGLAAAAPRKTEHSAPTRAKRPVRRTARPAPVQEAPRQVGSNEVPVVEFVGTKTRAQVIAEMMQARRAAARQAARGGPMAMPDNRILPN